MESSKVKQLAIACLYGNRLDVTQKFGRRVILDKY